MSLIAIIIAVSGEAVIIPPVPDYTVTHNGVMVTHNGTPITYTTS